MNRRHRFLDCFPDRREQSVVISVLLAGLAALAIAGVYVGFRHGGWQDIEDPNARRMVRFVVKINEADWTEIAQLPRIGPTLARRIVEYRDTHGDFPSTAQLKDVPGIGEKLLAAILPYITIGDAPPSHATPPPNLARRR